MQPNSQDALRPMCRWLELGLGGLVAAVFGWLVIKSLADGMGVGLIVAILLLMD